MLLTGARGTGKSSLVKAVFNQFSAKGLRLIEVDKDDLVHLPEIVDLIVGRRERFIIFCDDLSFESGEPVRGTPRSGTLGALQSGALEDSNVELSDQLVNLIVAQRNYQANAKTIETESAVTQTIINLR